MNQPALAQPNLKKVLLAEVGESCHGVPVIARFIYKPRKVADIAETADLAGYTLDLIIQLFPFVRAFYKEDQQFCDEGWLSDWQLESGAWGTSVVCRSLTGVEVVVFNHRVLPELCLDRIREELSRLSGSGLNPCTPDHLARAASDFYGLQYECVIGLSRQAPHMLARQVAMYLAKEELDMKLEMIGKFFFDRDRATVKHSIDKISDEVSRSSDLEAKVKIIFANATKLAQK